ncbi:GH32 C-terminal domain-containing protein [Halobacillus amylolyticus]|uniref:GH32 C-terminal domain-containing protein n=1 Tax=Halobacillus amylolyticus TaxID=2932259 RepID=UPI002961F471|nr:GH32 C-terminal domain-containing protein [Halobacillus amylolyticus]
MPEQDDYWAGAITIPRIISIEDGQLKSVPVPELKSLRCDHISYENVEVESECTFEGVEGTSLELNVVIDSKDASAFGMRVRCNESETEETKLLYDVKQEVFILDRNHSGAGPGGIRRAPLSLKDGRLHLRVFIDQSSLEVFLQNGEKVMTARIYPGKNSEGIQFFSDDKIEMVQLDKWSLNQSIDVTEFNK